MQLEEWRRVDVVVSHDERRAACSAFLDYLIRLRESSGAGDAVSDGIECLRRGPELCTQLAISYCSYSGEERERER